MKKYRTSRSNKLSTKIPPLENILYWQLFILTATFIFYFPSFSLEFVNWDDDIYIYGNPFIQSLSVSNIKNIFSSFFHGNYHPLTMLTYAIENAIAGETPFIYHFTNVVFHLGNTYLVFIFTHKLFRLIRLDDSSKTGLIIAVISSLLFGVHPFHVESVSWISERKDVLYTFFFLIGLISYLRYVQMPKIKGYLLVLLLFLLSLLSKGMAVSFSVTLLVIDYVLKRELLSKRVILEKVPFLLISLVFGFIAIQAQKDLDAIVAGDVYSMVDKIAFSSYGLVTYFIKLFVPFNLCHYYPYPTHINGAYPIFYYLFPFAVLSILSVIVVFFRKSRVVIFGFMFFIINIFLVLKFIQVGGVIMADRYTYLASIGIFLVIALLFEYLFTQKILSKGKVVAILVIYVLSLGIQTHQRTKVWKTSLSLWNDANSKFPQDPTILLNRATGHVLEGNVEMAVKDYKSSIKFDPDNYKAYTNLGNIELSRGNFQQSIELFTKSIALNSNREKAFCSRGQALLNIGRVEEALKDFNMAIELNSTYADAYRYRGSVMYMKKAFTEAINDFNTTIKYNPNYAEAYFGRGLCYFNLNSKAKACSDMHKAADLNFTEALRLINKYCK